MVRVGNISKQLKLLIWSAGIIILFIPFELTAQYFGQNKPAYMNFQYNVYQTPHFEIYNYVENDSLRLNLARSAEEWYQLHHGVLRDTFELRNPMIIYNNHADFQQTRAINSLIGIGTGGVTEALKNRVIFPVAFTNAQTDHVLGHEMVHAFQYHMLIHGDSSSLNSIQNLPLWMVEGMAEYLSIGSVDPNTSMWMRDALISKDFPTLKDMTRESKYFPYRYGHAFWAMVGKSFGDSLIVPLFMKTAQLGYEKAIQSVLGFGAENLSGMWKSALELHYKDYMKDTIDYPVGNKLISVENAGRINVSPSISPDGRYIAFLSEKDFFTLDLYLAEVETGKIIKKLSSTTKNDEIDDFNFIESAGTWSPDGKKFAFVIISEGINKLAILDVKKAKIIEEIKIPDIPSFINPSWSPDGRFIVLSGLVQGQTDLYLYEVKTGKVEQLTDDWLANIHPSWSSDGKSIVFASEKVVYSGNSKKYCFDLAILDPETKGIRYVDIFPGAMNLNPVFSPDNRSIYFLSDKDGCRNLYRYDTGSGKICRLTDYITGISGITAYSPAIDIARNTGQLVYTYYGKNSYQIFSSDVSDFIESETDPSKTHQEAGILPPIRHLSENLVDSSLYNRPFMVELPVDTFRKITYRPKFKLDYISNVQAGVSASRYGTGMAGAVNMIFSDIVGNNQLYAALAMNGEVFDVGAQIAYINQRRNLNWGAVVSHIPYLSGRYGYMDDSLNYYGERIPVNDYFIDLMRMFKDEISVFSFYPFSRTRRLEAGASVGWYYFRIDRYHNYYIDNIYKIAEKKEKIDAPGGFALQQVDLAYVEDNSFYGMTAPMQGHRARFQVEKYFGELSFYSALIDYRKYFFHKPVNLSFRLYHYGRYGNSSESQLMAPLYLGYPWLVRGYESRSFYRENTLDNNSLTIDQLTGSKMIVSNIELRVPFSGPERYALITSKWFYADLNFFIDGGLAWSSSMKPAFKWQPDSNDETIPVFSLGTGFRINFFGYVVIEPFYAIPLQNGGWSNGSFGLNFLPGW
ncbi:MAG: tolB protein precursor [Bacteroides sp. SM23_62_1]|nr:MAG: tolB protein precursor [Bacteroides sp. SM23_62_1]